FALLARAPDPYRSGALCVSPPARAPQPHEPPSPRGQPAGAARLPPAEVTLPAHHARPVACGLPMFLTVSLRSGMYFGSPGRTSTRGASAITAAAAGL